MRPFASLASLALLLAPAVHASVYVTNPVQASQCAGGQACQVQWVDNGEAPLLSDIGECQVAVYTGNYQLVQSLPSVDVSTTSSFVFTPDPAAGADGSYYIVFTANSINYQGFSGSFTLTGMNGGGSSAPASIPATGTSTDTSVSAGSTTPATTPAGTASTPSGTTPTPTLTTPTVATTPTSATNSFTTPTTTTPRTTSTSASASATPSNAAGRIGSSTSLGGLAALLALSGVLAF